MWQRKIIHLKMARKKRERVKETRVPIVSSRVHPQLFNFLPLGPTSNRFYHLPVVLQIGDQVFNT
jgi:hypothetical protein